METNLSNDLYHYGVLGMKWGVRKSRPTSSGKKRKTSSIKKKLAKLKKEQAERRRKAILDDPAKLYKNRKKFTKDEIDQAMKQFEWENRLKQQSVDRIKKGQEEAAKILGLMTTGLGMYDQVARVYNTFVAKDNDSARIPYLEKADSSKNKKKKEEKENA